jgi:hypothetical protein
VWRGRNGTPSVLITGPSTSERVYGPDEVATIWRCSVKTIQRIFQDRDDVLKLGTHKRGKRSYDTIRIPASTLERVFRERCKKM